MEDIDLQLLLLTAFAILYVPLLLTSEYVVGKLEKRFKFKVNVLTALPVAMMVSCVMFFLLFLIYKIIK